MSWENNTVVQRYKNLLEESGKSIVHGLFPNDFELYICALELVDSKNQTVEYFVFPIMPSSIKEDDPTLQNIKKTAGGIIVIGTTTFTTRSISLQGNFGRKFKFLIGRKNISGSALQYSTQGGKFNKESIKSGTLQTRKAVFDSDIKTGYGCIKILESIYDKSRTVDEDGNPYRLYFYNLATGNHYLVRCNDFSKHQDLSTNMIWNYTLSMTGLAPLEGIRDEKDVKSSLTKITQYSLLGKGVDVTVQSLIDEISLQSNITVPFQPI